MKYQDFKSLATANTLLVQYEASLQEYRIFAFDGPVRLDTYILRQTDGVDGLSADDITQHQTDLVDFEANMMPNANKPTYTKVKNYGFSDFPTDAVVFLRKSFAYDIPGGQTTFHSEKFTGNTYLFSGEYEIAGGTPAWGDYVEFLVTDEDNLLGYGAGLVLAQYIQKEYINPKDGVVGVNTHRIAGNSAKQVPNGFYYTIKYVSAGAATVNDIKLIARYEVRKP